MVVLFIYAEIEKLQAEIVTNQNFFRVQFKLSRGHPVRDGILVEKMNDHHARAIPLGMGY